MRELRAGPFRLDRPIGAGAMGTVWRGAHEDGTPVALKLLTDAAWRDPRISLLVQNEVRVIAGLDHDAIVALYDAGTVSGELAEASHGKFPEGSPWLAMELAPAGDLRRAPVAWSEARDILLALLDALAHAHARGVLHRDLKPDNVLRWDQRGGAPPVKLADFGLAAIIGADPRVRAGTPAFMAPEQITGQWRDLGPQTDLYALGCLAWALVTGAPPFRGKTTAILQAQVQKELPALRARLPVPAGLAGWLSWLLEKSPRQRCGRAADAALALSGLGDAEGSGERAEAVDASSTWISSITDASFEAVVVPPTGPSGAAPPPFPRLPAGPHQADLHLAGAGRGLYFLRVPRMVGREAVAEAAWAVLGEVVTRGEPRVLLLRGPRGIGTRRVARWIAERAHELGQADVSRADPTVADALARRLGVHDLDPSAAIARLQSLGWPEGVEAAALAHALVGDAPLRPVLQSTLARMGQERAQILWIDRPSLEDLVLVTSLLGGSARVLVLVTGDDAILASEAPIRSAWIKARAAGATEIALPPLDPHTTRTLVRELLGLAPVAAAHVAERCGGNPGFAWELVGTWLQQGVLRPSPQGYTLEDRAVPVPADRAHAWRTRLEAFLADRPADRPALQVAAALGPRVPTAIWHEVCERLGLALPSGLLDHLVRAALAYTSGPDAWAFADPSLALAPDVAVHRACAAAWERRGGPTERIAHHKLAAGDLEESLPWLLDASRADLGKGNRPRAELWLAEWEKAADALGIGPDDPRRAGGIVRRSTLLRAAGDSAAAQVFARRGLELADDDLSRARALTELGACLQDANASPLEVEKYVERAVASFEAAGQPQLAGSIQISLVFTAITARRPDLAAAYLERALPYVRGPVLEGRALRAASAIARELGDLQTAYAHLLAARKPVSDGGRLLDLANIENELGNLAELLGMPAEHHFRASIPVYDLVGGWKRALPRINLARILITAGRSLEAAQVIEVALREVRSVPDNPIGILVRATWLGVLAFEGDAETFDRTFEEVAAFREGMGFNGTDVATLLDATAAAARHAGWAERAARVLALQARLRA